MRECSRIKYCLFTKDDFALINAILFAPDVFEKILILDNLSDSVDFGCKQFWLRIREDINWPDYFTSDNVPEIAKNIRDNYFVSETKIEETSGYFVIHFTERFYNKSFTGDGEIFEEGCYRNRILKHLEYLKTK